VHESESPQHVVIKAATQPARSVLSILSDLHPAFAHIVDRALELTKPARWPNAKEMREALSKACADAFGAVPSKTDLATLVDAKGGGEAPVAPSPVGAPPPAAVTPGASPAPAPGPVVQSGRTEVMQKPDGASSTPRPTLGAGAAGVAVTGAPTSSVAAPAARNRTAVTAGIGIAVIAVVATIGVVALKQLRHEAKEPVGAQPSAIVSDSPLAASAAPSAAPSAIGDAPASSAVAAPVAEAVTARTTSPATAPAQPKSSLSARPANAQPSAKPSSAAGVSSTTNPNCNPPYVLDADNNKHFKPECFQKK
jgi:S-DNA-T family DNA segregation ATPase FtsK/SpoIIIE